MTMFSIKLTESSRKKGERSGRVNEGQMQFSPALIDALFNRQIRLLTASISDGNPPQWHHPSEIAARSLTNAACITVGNLSTLNPVYIKYVPPPCQSGIYYCSSTRCSTISFAPINVFCFFPAPPDQILYNYHHHHGPPPLHHESNPRRTNRRP